MARFTDESIVKEIKGRLSIINLIESYTSLKKSGKNYVGLCPFHDDKNPSMHVDEDKGLFHCFSCGAGGDMFGFLMRYNNISFPEALEELAKQANVEIRKPTKTERAQKSQQSKLFKINSLVSNFYHRALNKSKEGAIARDYIRDRGITAEMCTELELGFAPSGWDKLVNYLEKKNVPLGLASELGLVIKRSGKSGYYDRFRNRLIFPIRNIEGKVTGFGGRILDDSEQAKYINSPESEIYHKRSILYGIDKSKDFIRKADKVILVEGYMDYLSLFQAGVKNVVAVSGTSLTKNHIAILRRYTDRVVLVFDSDSSGMNAAIRSLGLFIEQDVNPYIALLPEGHDPDSFIKSEGVGVFERIVDNAHPLIDFYVQSIVDEFAAGNQSLAKSKDQVVSLLSTITDPIERSRQIKIAAEKFGVREAEFASSLRLQRKTHSRSSVNITDLSSATELMILKLVLEHPGLRGELTKTDWQGLISNTDIKGVLDNILEDDESDVSTILLGAKSDAAQRLISEAVLGGDDIVDEESARAILSGCMTKLQAKMLEEHLKVLRLEMQKASKKNDHELEKKLLEEYTELMKKNNNRTGEPYEN